MSTHPSINQKGTHPEPEDNVYLIQSFEPFTDPSKGFEWNADCIEAPNRETALQKYLIAHAKPEWQDLKQWMMYPWFTQVQTYYRPVSPAPAPALDSQDITCPPVAKIPRPSTYEVMFFSTRPQVAPFTTFVLDPDHDLNSWEYVLSKALDQVADEFTETQLAEGVVEPGHWTHIRNAGNTRLYAYDKSIHLYAQIVELDQ